MWNQESKPTIKYGDSLMRKYLPNQKSYLLKNTKLNKKLAEIPNKYSKKY